MKVAIYHNLPPGGAMRVLHEFVRRSHTEHEYDLYSVDLGRLEGFAMFDRRHLWRRRLLGELQPEAV